MIINWYKYIRDLLPPALRLTRLVEMLKVLNWQVPKANYDFDLFLASANYKVNVKASVVALEKLIHTELDAIATIEELDGQPFDFLVNVHSVVDEKRLKALIDAYKLEGKSYTFKLGTVAYTADYINHVCEDIIEAWSAAYTDYQCEQDGKNYIKLFLGFETGGDIRITASAQLPVQTELHVIGNINAYNELHEVITGSSFDITIAVGEVSAYDDVAPVVGAMSYDINYASVHITPVADTYYNYLIEQ